METTLPHGSHVLARSDVWLETNARDQLDHVARLPGCRCAVGMPDLHAGRGIPVGAVAAFPDRVVPTLVGSDAGCGARLTLLSIKAPKLDRLERRLRATMDEAPWDADLAETMLAQAYRHGPHGLSDVMGLPDDLRALAGTEAPEPDLGALPEAYRPFADALRTIGGGNHFLEVSRVDEVVAASHRDHQRAVAVLAHSGSRGLGHALAQRFREFVEAEERVDYLRELAGAVRFARTNRLLLTYRALRALGAHRLEDHRLTVDVTHNTVTRERFGEESFWVHRKGAAPAHAGQLTVLLGSREAPSWLLRGTGSVRTVASVAHGAGRRMTRSEALAKLKARHQRASLRRTASGGRVLCDDAALLYEEHPAAYKAVGPVLGSLVEAGVAEPLLSLRPLITVKL